MEQMTPINHRIRDQTLIKGGQLTSMRASKREEIAVCDLSGLQEAGRVQVPLIKQGNIVWPKCMTWQLPQRRQQSSNCGGSAGGVWISRMTDNAQHSVFCKRTGRPGVSSLRREPFVCTVMLNVTRINKGNQDVDVQKKPGHGSSSRS